MSVCYRQTGLLRWLCFKWLISTPFHTKNEASTEGSIHHRALEREKGGVWNQAEVTELHLTQQAHESHAHAGTGTRKPPCCLTSEHADASIRSTTAQPHQYLHRVVLCIMAAVFFVTLFTVQLTIEWLSAPRGSNFSIRTINIWNFHIHKHRDDYASALIKGKPNL